MRAAEVLVQGLCMLTSFLIGAALCLACSEARLKAFEVEAVEKGAAYYEEKTGEFKWKRFIEVNPSQGLPPLDLFNTDIDA